jgi:hypothetical protein
VPGGRPMKVDPQVIVDLDTRVVTIGNLIPVPSHRLMLFLFHSMAAAGAACLTD